MSQGEVKMLPINTDSTSKGYITYNPSKFDIIPVTCPQNDIRQDTSINSSVEACSVIPLSHRWPNSANFIRDNGQYSTSHSDGDLELKDSRTISTNSKSDSGFVNHDLKLPMITHHKISDSELKFKNFEMKVKGPIPNLSATVDPIQFHCTNKLASSQNEALKLDKSIVKEESSLRTVFKSLQSLLDGENESVGESLEQVNAPRIFMHVDSTRGAPLEYADALKVKSERMSQQNEADVIHKSNGEDLTIEGLLGDTFRERRRNSLSDRDQNSNSSDNFEMVYVKSEPSDTDYYQETKDSTPELLKKRQEASQKRSVLRKNESPEQRAKRLVQIRDAARYRRSNETLEQRMERLRKDREKKRRYRAKMKQDATYEQLLAKNRIIMRLRRQDEAYRERERERDRIRHQIRRADAEFRHREKVKERERKRISRFLKKCAQHFTSLQHFAHQLFVPQQDANSQMACTDV